MSLCLKDTCHCLKEVTCHCVSRRSHVAVSDAVGQRGRSKLNAFHNSKAKRKDAAFLIVYNTKAKRKDAVFLTLHNTEAKRKDAVFLTFHNTEEKRKDTVFPIVHNTEAKRKDAVFLTFHNTEAKRKDAVFLTVGQSMKSYSSYSTGTFETSGYSVEDTLILRPRYPTAT